MAMASESGSESHKRRRDRRAKSAKKKPSKDRPTVSSSPVSGLHAGLASDSVIVIGPSMPNVISRNATKRGNHSSDLRQKRRAAAAKKPSTTQLSRMRL